ncbi:hypothetical protein KCP75_24635 [Salmonella enterica subsp. enterica]|nr:hypothetical protein KCP75_24635 [Salmonella enterica subsp. enterica]
MASRSDQEEASAWVEGEIQSGDLDMGLPYGFTLRAQEHNFPVIITRWRSAAANLGDQRGVADVTQSYQAQAGGLITPTRQSPRFLYAKSLAQSGTNYSLWAIAINLGLYTPGMIPRGKR